VLLHCRSAGTGKLDVVAGSNADVIGLDWSTSMRVCRQVLGPQHKVQGNVDPMVLFGTQVGLGEAGLRCSEVQHLYTYSTANQGTRARCWLQCSRCSCRLSLCVVVSCVHSLWQGILAVQGMAGSVGFPHLSKTCTSAGDA
jgi:hypothetical protein